MSHYQVNFPGINKYFVTGYDRILDQLFINIFFAGELVYSSSSVGFDTYTTEVMAAEMTKNGVYLPESIYEALTLDFAGWRDPNSTLDLTVDQIPEFEQILLELGAQEFLDGDISANSGGIYVRPLWVIEDSEDDAEYLPFELEDVRLLIPCKLVPTNLELADTFDKQSMIDILKHCKMCQVKNLTISAQGEVLLHGNI